MSTAAVPGAQVADPAASDGAEPEATGHFGRYGGRLAPEALMSALDELTAAYAAARAGRKSVV